MGLRVALLGAALACLATGAEAAQTKISMIIYTAPGIPFFNPLIKGAQDAAKEADVDLDIQYATTIRSCKTTSFRPRSPTRSMASPQ